MRGPVAALSWALAVIAAVSPSACKIDDRSVAVAPLIAESPGGNGPSDAGDQPAQPGCLPGGCPEDDACRSFAGGPASSSRDAGCVTLADCPFTWKPAAREGDACRCDDSGCSLLTGEVCTASAACQAGSCVATADGRSVCCAQACAETEVCAPDGSSCVPAEPCSGDGRRCSGALHQSCVEGVWQTLTDCAALGCSNELDGCLRRAGQACESDAECGEGRCLATASGNRICCSGGCDTSCQRCSAEGDACESIADDETCGSIECPADPCRVYDPATVVTNRCSDGRCATPEEACAVFQPQRSDLECSATALCDEEGACSRPKRDLLAECGSGEQCASGACVATTAGQSVCCSQACAASEVCSPTGTCVPAPVCDDDSVQCSGSNFQRCVRGQWVTDVACGALGCSVAREGCFARAGETCSTSAECGEGTCQETASGGSVCCTAACDGPCRVCGASGTACANLQDDAACGAIACPRDTTCRDFPLNVTALRCIAGACGSAAQLCQGIAINAGQACSATNLCDSAGNCSLPKKSNGALCGGGSECASNNCVDGVCCNTGCSGTCETCAPTGICHAATTDTSCGPVTCGSFDADCVTNTDNTSNACAAQGRCRSTSDCGFRPRGTRCGEGGVCNGQGSCEPSVECGVRTCSGGEVCCSMFDFNANALTLACSSNGVCPTPTGFVGPIVEISCDQDADCVDGGECCMVTTNVNSGEISCRPTCTAADVAEDLGAPPEMLVVGRLCVSEEGPLFTCPTDDCDLTVSTLSPDYVACRE